MGLFLKWVEGTLKGTEFNISEQSDKDKGHSGQSWTFWIPMLLSGDQHPLN